MSCETFPAVATDSLLFLLLFSYCRNLLFLFCLQQKPTSYPLFFHNFTSSRPPLVVPFIRLPLRSRGASSAGRHRESTSVCWDGSNVKYEHFHTTVFNLKVFERNGFCNHSMGSEHDECLRLRVVRLTLLPNRPSWQMI